MPGVSVGVTAAGDFADLRKRMAGAPKELRSTLTKALADASKPLADAARENAQKTLPTGGGRSKTSDGDNESVADRVIGARFTTKVKGGNRPKSVITATEAGGKTIDLARLDRGRLRHPLFGNAAHWYAQKVPERWFSKPMSDSAEQFEKSLTEAVDRVTKDIFG